MAVSDYMQPGLTSKQVARIITVDPAKRRIEGALKDGAMIQIAVWEIPTVFRWPVAGELWTVRRDQGYWVLGSRFELLGDAQGTIETLNEGDVKIASDTIITSSGFQVLTTGDTLPSIDPVTTTTVAQLEVLGHSVAQGAGAETLVDSYGEKAARALGVGVYNNRSWGGSVSCWHQGQVGGDGGWVWVTQQVKRPGQPGHLIQAPSAPYLPHLQVAIHHHAYNDLAYLGPTKPLPMQHAHRRIWSHLCASGLWPYTKTLTNIGPRLATTGNANRVVTGLSTTTDLAKGMYVTGTGIQPGTRIQSIDTGSRITLDKTATGSTTGLTFSGAGGGWTFTTPSTAWTPTANLDVSTLGVNSNSTVGSRATFTLPADYPGGLVVGIALAIAGTNNVAPVIKASIDGAVVEATLDSGPGLSNGSMNYDAMTDSPHVLPNGDTSLGKWNGIVLRFGDSAAWPGSAPLSAGSHQIQLEVMVKGGAGVFAPALAVEYGLIEAHPLDGPLLVVPNNWRNLTSGVGAYANWSDSAIAIWNTALSNIFSEFPDRLVDVDIDAVLGKSSTLLSTDFVHLNSLGHAEVADAITSAIQISTQLTDRLLSRALQNKPTRFHDPWGTFGRTPLYGWTYSSLSAAYEPPSHSRSLDGIVTLRGAVIKPSAPTSTRTGNITINQATVTGLSVSSADLTPGMAVSGTSIPAGTRIKSIQSSSAITLTANASATATPRTLTISVSNLVTKLPVECRPVNRQILLPISINNLFTEARAVIQITPDGNLTVLYGATEDYAHNLDVMYSID